MKSLKFLCVPVAMAFIGIGCGEESKVTKQETIKTPEGTSKVTTETKVESTGKNPPVPAKP